MMIIFAFKKRELKEKTQDANFSIPIKNPESANKKRIPDSDSKIGPKISLLSFFFQLSLFEGKDYHHYI